MISIFMAVVVVFTFLTLLTNVFIIQGKFRKFLFILIPIQLTLATFGYIVFSSVQGYATHDLSELNDEQHKFKYIHHFMGGEELYLLAYPFESKEPRLYVFKGDNEEQKKKLQKLLKGFKEAQGQKKAGNQVSGFIDQEKSEPIWKIKTFQQLAPKE